jgi:hypothetical protein
MSGVLEGVHVPISGLAVLVDGFEDRFELRSSFREEAVVVGEDGSGDRPGIARSLE